MQTTEHVINITRTFDAPRSLVWAAWTDPKHITKWWGPQGFNNTVRELDLRPGGAFLLHLRGPDGTVYPCKGTFSEVHKPERIVYLGEAEECHPCGAGLPPRAQVTITFSEQDKKTTLTVHTIFESALALEAAAKGGFNVGWSQGLERLAELISTI